ncbi:MAG TPA: efflux RND transporter periplasmic adaptor subunit [Hanamia sp.]|nr:efflux RND transporter periplasmic adaptor subunit [Hanamia sp.]
MTKTFISKNQSEKDLSERGGKVTLLIFLLPALVFFASCGNDSQKKGGGPGGQATQIKTYPVLNIVPQTTTLYTDYPATIEGQQNIEIRPKIDGYVEKMFVDEGATVKKGQRLFQISAPQYEQDVRTAFANIKIAQADVNAAEMNVNKVRPLVDKNIISKYELESAEYTLQAKQAALAQANATLANARTNQGYTLITSPANGVVGTIPYKIGSLVSSNTAEPLTTVSNIGNIYAYFSINEKQALDFSKNTKGATTEARLASLPPVSLVLADGSLFAQKGRIETASGMINTQTGSVSVRATFPNPGNMVRSGSSGAVRIPSTVDSAILIPQKSTYEIQGKKFVYLVSDSGTVQSVEIKIMNNSGGQFFVVKDGLKPGDKIVVEGVATLREGSAIKPVPVNTDSLYQQLLRKKPTDSLED